ncbi:dihydrodipicolinate synthase family protein [Chelatococcus asaccharovorans]|uniref:dihydrodipicolinate synthase family protein n=1 Tax=Chelatococcus asaccharovorans TaxID=28210 RepID=UPI00224C7A6D|nr:dihydrodipicolinate synthase family protein [Chelatococcus asaccharovorans]CAH1658956.1 Dihydrodipicolinate synthase [Chelatococcus asaccharovorans]CAH1688267.1 Dihydrodipicolinate synthase [Chelatococcus asaccharovorans]
MLLDETAAGVYVIAVTPFRDDGALDLSSLDSMVDFYLEKGADGLTILGMMGEAPKLTGAESVAVARQVLRRVDGRVPVVVGVSAPGFASMVELSQAVMDLGAAGVMVAPPSTLRTDDQIVQYYRTAGDMLGATPFVLQDFPLSTQVQIAPAVLDRIIAAVPTCVMIKHEDWPGLAKIEALRQTSAKGGRRVSILTGNGGLFLPEELQRGADGAMTGFAYPEMMVGISTRHAAGDSEGAQDLFDAYLPLARYEQQPGLGLAVRKYVLAKRGAIASASLRRPGPKLGAADIREIERLIARQTRRLDSLR